MLICRIAGMRSFDTFVREAAAADVTGWEFGWLEGRATEERPPWGYAKMLAARLATAKAALDIETGGGEVVAEAPTLPPRMCVTEGWPPNAARARVLLGPRGVEVYETVPGAALPLPDQLFDLVTSRHPVRPDWEEIHRVLSPGGHYFAQHVGPASAFELIEYFLGPLPQHRFGRDPQRETEAAEKVGLRVTDLQTARCQMAFFDIGAVVWILRKCIGWVPDFTVKRYYSRLVELDSTIRRQGEFVAHSTRHLIEGPALKTSLIDLMPRRSTSSTPLAARRDRREATDVSRVPPPRYQGGSDRGSGYCRQDAACNAASPRSVGI